MSQSIHSPSESFARTTTSADSGAVVGQGVQTATNPSRCPVFHIDLYRAKIEETPDGHISIEDYVSQSERDPERATALQEARNWVASSFYGNERDTIRALRLSRGLSQARLASLADTTQAHIARIEAGSTDCQVGTLQRIAKALEVDELLTVKAFLITRGTASRISDDD